MKTFVSHGEEIIKLAAEQISDLLRRKPDAVLALSVGESQRDLFKALAERYRAGELSFKDARIVLVTEFVTADEGATCKNAFVKGFADVTDINLENCFFLSEENYERCDSYIESVGGIDLAVLGIGVNAHIGFNEPATPFDSRTHIQKLTNATRRQLADRFGGEENVPERGITLGIKTITEARDILVLAFGEAKAEAVFRMVYGRTEPYIPASFLQIPLSVTVYADLTAGAKL